MISDDRRPEFGDSVLGSVTSFLKPKSTVKSRLTLTTGQSVVVVQGDLTEYKVDVIVNAANEDMAHVGGIAKAIVDKGYHVGGNFTMLRCIGESRKNLLLLTHVVHRI